jgi:hypothetical protein
MTDRELLFCACYAYEALAGLGGMSDRHREAYKKLREKLSEPTIDGWPLYSGLPQPEPEPVAYMDSKGHLYNSTTHPENYTPLYTAPPQREWVGLTDEERANCSAEAYGRHFVLCELIEAKLKEKNT